MINSVLRVCLQMCRGRAVKVEPSSRVAPVRSGPSGRTNITPSRLVNSTHTPTPARRKFSRYHTHTHTPAVCQSVLAADQCTQICNMSDRDVSDLRPPSCVSAGHVTHGWRSHSGNSQLQHWGLCWPWHVPTLLWVKAPPPSITLPLRTGLMFAFISCCPVFFLCCWITNTWWLLGCTCHSHTNTQLTNV